MSGYYVGTKTDAAILAQMIKNAGNGDHLDIGTAWGGSAIIAALTKKRYELNGTVFTVDPLESEDVLVGTTVTPELIRWNLREFGIDDRVSFRQIPSQEFEGKIVSAYIDGSHKGREAKKDLELVKGLGAKVVIAHDYDSKHLGVTNVIPKSKIVALLGSSAVLTF